MAIVMDMSSYEIERESAIEEYGDEVMCAGWNPQLALASERPLAPVDQHATFPEELAQVDADTFLRKMYTYQR